MKDMKYSDILMLNQKLEESMCSERYEIQIISNIVINQLQEILECSLRMDEINAEVKISNYDNIVQSSDKYKESRAIIIFWELGNIIEGFHYKANLMNDKEINLLVEKVKLEIEYVFSNLQNVSLLIMNKFSTILFNHNSLRTDKFDSVCQELNEFILKCKPDNIVFIDIDRIIARLSVNKSCDFRHYYSSKSLYSFNFLKEYCVCIKHIISNVNGRQKKILIVDCDNTLWNGIVGETEINDLEMSNFTSKGRIFEEVQSIIYGLNKEAILLGICSKNNPIDVDNVINNHPYMTIGQENIVIKKINWNDKVSNIKEIAQELNIGLNSIVFLDDSDIEVDYVRHELNEVLTLQVPKELSMYPSYLKEHFSVFYRSNVTKEDTEKTNIYKKQFLRETYRKKFCNIEDYLRTLELKMELHFDNIEKMTRLAQLTQKTNQYNLTTKRYTKTDISNSINSNNNIVVGIEVSDKFGSYGLTGVVIINTNLDLNIATLDTFLLSCRIIGRNIEFALMDQLIAHLLSINIQKVNSKYVKTLKNSQVASFYQDCGFETVNSNDEFKEYCLSLSDYRKFNLDYIEVK